jgi:hypothetical protein
MVDATELRTRAATLADAAAIAAIYNEGIADRIATFETVPRSAGQIAEWFTGPQLVILAETEETGPVAFAASFHKRFGRRGASRLDYEDRGDSDALHEPFHGLETAPFLRLAPPLDLRAASPIQVKLTFVEDLERLASLTTSGAHPQGGRRNAHCYGSNGRRGSFSPDGGDARMARSPSVRAN